MQEVYQLNLRLLVLILLINRVSVRGWRILLASLILRRRILQGLPERYNIDGYQEN